MASPLRQLLSAAALGLAALCAAPAYAGPYSGLYIFGDSLSDSGNNAVATATLTRPNGVQQTIANNTYIPTFPYLPQPGWNNALGLATYSNGNTWATSFAAQLGTMKLTEEIDAMRTIGVSPIEALVLPRLLAAVFMMPLLGFFSTLISIIGGGLFCWLSLDMPPVIYVQRLQEVIPLTDVWVGMVKAPVFGLIIAMTGCYQGMQVKGNAEEVGLKTTAAVVQAIFLVIVLDAFFAVFFTKIGWT